MTPPQPRHPDRGCQPPEGWVNTAAVTGLREVFADCSMKRVARFKPFLAWCWVSVAECGDTAARRWIREQEVRLMESVL